MLWVLIRIAVPIQMSAHNICFYGEKPGALAWSDLRRSGMQPFMGSILISSYFLSWSLVMKQILRPFSLSLIQEGQLSVTGERMCTEYW